MCIGMMGVYVCIGMVNQVGVSVYAYAGMYMYMHMNQVGVFVYAYAGVSDGHMDRCT